MARFLTDEWLRELAAAARTAVITGWPVGERLTIEQVIGATGGCEVSRWALEISDEGVRVFPGGVDRPDLTFSSNAATASALAQGSLNAQQALADGRLRVRGDPTRLAALHDALAALSDIFAAARDSTDYTPT